MLRTLFVAVLAASGFAEAAFSQQRAAPNNLFTASGFVVRYADTPEKLAHLRKLPPDKLVSVARSGKTYYLYADQGCRCVYVGTPEAYRTFQGGGRGPSFSDGPSRAQQIVDEFKLDSRTGLGGGPSFDDYVFGGMLRN